MHEGELNPGLPPNTAQGWSRDVTEEIADELRNRCVQRGEIPGCLQEFLDEHSR